MLKSLLPLVIAFIFGWLLHVLYVNINEKSNTKHISLVTGEEECSEDEKAPEVFEKIVYQDVVQFVPQTKIVYKTKQVKNEDNVSDPFMLALAEKKFYDAMSYYEEADEEKHPSYQTALAAFFSQEQIKNPIQTVEQMQYFIEIESESKLIVFQLAQLFEKKEAYLQALNLIINFSYVADYTEIRAIHTRIKSISLAYIKKLSSSDNLKSLIDFLITQRNIGVLSEFYAFELAKAYLSLKKYTDSAEVLEELTKEEMYKERALELLSFVEQKMEEQREYPIQIPLVRRGSHFIVQAYVDDIAVSLMLDTGASTTSIDHDLVSHLKVVKKNALFHTAGGTIYSSIYQAGSFSIGEVSLKDFNVVGYLFPSSGDNGLLGMNFLSQFRFKIDQEEAILFLGNKKY